MLLAQVPHVLQRGSLYASAAIAGAGLYVLLARLTVDPVIASLAGMTCVAVVRIAAILWELKLTAFEIDPGRQPNRETSGS